MRVRRKFVGEEPDPESADQDNSLSIRRGATPPDPGPLAPPEVQAMERNELLGTSRVALALLALLPAALPAQSDAPGRVAGRSKADVRAAARQIDALVEADLAQNQLSPNPLADDATFVRRAYLGLVGRIPTLEETEAFLDSHKSERRRDLIDELLDSPGYESHMFNYWADLLRAKSKLARQTSGEPYIHWLKQAVAENVPYDDFVSQLLTATGAAHARDNGATGYYLRDRGMPEDNMSNTVRVFLGTRLECAQCHNHPFDKWSQKQFFEMAAFTGGIRYTDDNSQRNRQQYQGMLRDLREEHGAQAQRAFRRMMQPVANGVSGTGAGLTQLPKDYQYDDAKPKEFVKAKAMFGEDPGLDVSIPAQRERRGRNRRRNTRRERGPRMPEIDSRAAYAEWMTSPDNPRFTTVIGNRMWKRVMGLGLIEPVDNLTDETVASNPELMSYLEKLMVEFDYDLVQFQRVLFHTKTAQRAATQRQPGGDEVYHFPGPILRRMTAEQIWDSVLTLVVLDLDERLDPAGESAERVYERYERLANLDKDELSERVGVEVLRYTDPDRYRQVNRQQRRAMMQEANAERGEGQRKTRQLRRELAKARRARDQEREAEILAELRELGVNYGSRRSAGSRRLARASDLPSPAPPGHLLRRFGQSDREQIEAGHSDANVPQVLTLLNGFVEQRIMRPESLLMQTIKVAPKSKDKVRLAYLSILNREPEPAEVRMWTAERSKQMPRDLVWTLLNTNEFRFVQ